MLQGSFLQNILILSLLNSLLNFRLSYLLCVENCVLPVISTTNVPFTVMCYFNSYISFDVAIGVYLRLAFSADSLPLNNPQLYCTIYLPVFYRLALSKDQIKAMPWCSFPLTHAFNCNPGFIMNIPCLRGKA